jgi:hypothetical protein
MYNLVHLEPGMSYNPHLVVLLNSPNTNAIFLWHNLLPDTSGLPFLMFPKSMLSHTFLENRALVDRSDIRPEQGIRPLTVSETSQGIIVTRMNSFDFLNQISTNCDKTFGRRCARTVRI